MSDRAVVPCNGCHLCCHMPTVVDIERGDDPSQYHTAMWMPPEGGPPITILARKDNGDCIYLTDNGCRIHDRAPRACCDYDCRALYRAFDALNREAAIKQGHVSRAIFDRGRELIEQESNADALGPVR